MKPSPEATYERARRLANFAMWTVSIQCRRIKSSEPEDDRFVMRKWADFHFLIVALIRLKKAAILAKKVPIIKLKIELALQEFDLELPDIKKMRDVAEHIDEYATDDGRNKNISRKSLEVSRLNETALEWLGFKLDADKAMEASSKLFEAIKDCSSSLRPNSD